MQAVASASAGPLPPGEQHRRTSSNATSIPSPHLHQPPSNSTPGAPAVRLPPVTVPREDFLPVAFNPERRQSINSDPFLHAFSATSDPSYLRRPSIDESSALFNSGYQPSNLSGQGGGDQTGLGRGLDRGTGMVAAGQTHSPRAGVSHSMPPPHSFDSHGNYQFGTSFNHNPHHDPQHQHQHQHQHHPGSSFPGPTSSYRFGGPSLNSHSAPLDPPSYFDYSMRRHSLTKSQSPTRFSHPPGPPPSAGGGGGGEPTSNSGTKRKSSGEEDEPSFNDGTYYPSQHPHQPPSMTGNPPPNSKRKTASVAATDKLNNLELGDNHSPAWEERRTSDESYRSSGSQQGGYSMFHPAQGGGPLPTPPPPPLNPNQNPNSHPPPQPQQGHPPFPMRPPSLNPPNFYDDSVGPRGSIARGMYEPEHQNFGRRPSIPGVSQMMQGQTPFYPGHFPHSAPPTAQHPPPPSPLPRTNGGSQPSLTISSIPHSTDPHHPPPQHPFPVGPPPQWPTSAPQPEGHATRQGSASSLDPNANLKDSPYSRSPELRISHKLAERKRRKEMAQLFDDLRESLPGDKGVKSSKWEILTKAVEFIGQMKAFNQDLQNDNQNLRRHLNLPQAPPPPHETRANNTPHPLQPAPTTQFVDQSHANNRPSSSHQQQSDSHAASPRPHPSRTTSNASHTSNLSIDNGRPSTRE